LVEIVWHRNDFNTVDEGIRVWQWNKSYVEPLIGLHVDDEFFSDYGGALSGNNEKGTEIA
jgi:hypothetical protein